MMALLISALIFMCGTFVGMIVGVVMKAPGDDDGMDAYFPEEHGKRRTLISDHVDRGEIERF